MENQKVRATKIENFEQSNIEAGTIFEGDYVGEPIVGRPFFVGNQLRTSAVHEILSENTFKTYNAIYKWEKI